MITLTDSYQIYQVKKKKILLLIPLLLIAWQLVDCWVTILFGDGFVRWQHYVALSLFAVLIFFYFKSFTKAVIATGVFLVLGTCNAFSMTVDINKTWFGIGPIETPPFNLLSFGLLILFFVLNFDTMINLYLDHKEAKQAKEIK